MKYQVPEIEIVRFDFENKVLTLQASYTGGAENEIPSGPVATEPGEYDPFA